MTGSPKRDRSDRVPKWAIVERWTGPDPEECITAFMSYKREAEALAKFWNGTTEDLEYRVELAVDAMARLTQEAA